MAENSASKAAVLISAKGAVRTGTNADWPGGAHNFNIFGIFGGPVRVTALFGYVRVGCTGVLLVPKLQYYPSVTGVGADTDICALAVGSAWPADTILSWVGTLLGVLAPTVGLGHSVPLEGFAGGLHFAPGYIRVANATADATAQIDWYMRYEPCNQVAYVTAQ